MPNKSLDNFIFVLEIVSGKKNKGFSDPECYLNLLGHAWRLWIQGRPMELLDERLKENCSESEVIRCIQAGLLCVQQRAEDMPDMAAVVLMLNGEKWLPQPKAPGFYTASDVPPDPTSSDQRCIQFSKNEISQSMPEGRLFREWHRQFHPASVFSPLVGIPVI